MKTNLRRLSLLALLLAPLALAEVESQLPPQVDDEPRLAATEVLIVTSDEGEQLICQKSLGAQSVAAQDDKITYDCRSEINEAISDNEMSSGAGRGVKEAQSIKDELFIETDQGSSLSIMLTSEQARKAKVDGLSHGELKAATVVVEQQKKFPVKFYTSVRMNLVQRDANTSFSDGGTRFGAFYGKVLGSGQEVYVHTQLGFNLIDDLSYLLTPDASQRKPKGSAEVNLRLLYAAYGRESLHWIAGKNWSTYSTVAGMTDRFLAVGGKATGLYNANTDGGAAGSGRADNVIQLWSDRKSLRYGLQTQFNTQIPALQQPVKYRYGVGGYVMWSAQDWVEGADIGVAYNAAVADQITPEMQVLGLDGNSETSVIGLQYERQKWFFATTFNRSRNHETDRFGLYYDAVGHESYVSYQLHPKYRLRTGHNKLTPRAQGDTLERVEEYYLSLQYTLNKKAVDDIMYLEYSHNRGVDSGGVVGKSVVMLGLRYEFDY